MTQFNCIAHDQPIAYDQAVLCMYSNVSLVLGFSAVQAKAFMNVANKTRHLN